MEVKFNIDTGLQIKGELVARGTQVDPIVFTSSQDSPAAGDWASIEFLPQSTDVVFDGNGDYASGSIIEQAQVAYGAGSGKQGVILIDGTAVFINRTTLEHNASSGIRLSNQSGELNKVSNSEIKNNSGYGIYVDAYQRTSVVTIDGCVIDNNSSGGISTGGGE